MTKIISQLADTLHDQHTYCQCNEPLILHRPQGNMNQTTENENKFDSKHFENEPYATVLDPPC